jgi:serine/threonine-protein kinase
VSSAPESEFLALQQALAGRYSLERELGRGGMGIVYIAQDVALERPVAIKLLPPALAGETDVRERFLREARIAAQLSHPHIVPIHLVEARGDLVYFVMALVEGESLGDRVRRTGPLSVPDAARVMREVAWALAYAHGRGVVHRDVKPDNILLERATGRALVTDFGIARSSAARPVTATGTILGTLQYMAPEQAIAAAVVDGRADIYALGVTAWFALTRRLPFEAESAPALIAAHLLEPAPPVTTVRADVPAALAEVVQRCLAKDPDGRFASGEDVADAVDRAAGRSAPIPWAVRNVHGALLSAGQQVALLCVVGLWVPVIAPDAAGRMLGLLLLLLAIPALNVLIAVRALIRDGYGPAEVEQAYRSAPVTGRTIEEKRHQAERLRRQLRSPIVRVFFGALGAVQIWEGGSLLIAFLTQYRAPLAAIMGALFLVGLGVLCLGLGTGLLIGWLDRFFVDLTPGRWTVLTGLASSRPARWLFRLAGLGLRGRLPIEGATTPLPAQPTEVLLGRAADELFAALSPSQRSALHDLPAVMRKLEVSAANLRARRDALARAIVAVGDPAEGGRRALASAELETERGRVEEGLRAVLEAMENLRLDLLRVRAGVGRSAEITAAIEAARDVGRRVDAMLEVE